MHALTPRIIAQKQSCKPLSKRKVGVQQFKLSDGEVTRDRDNLWVDCTVCSAATQYVVSECTDSSDRVCKTYTQCDSRYDYVLRKGGLYTDTVCAEKTRCTKSSDRSKYEKYPAVDSNSSTTNGTDAVCAPYSKCPDGHYMSFPGDDTNDVTCTLCPAGTYRNASLFASQDGGGGSIVYCRECPAGKYADQPGAVACKPCTNCLTSLKIELSDTSCPFSPPSKHCEPAIRTPCEPSRDTQCMACPSLSEQGGFERGQDDGICRPCKLGYYYNQSDPVEGRRCIPCAPGFYCPSKDRYVACPGTSIFQRWPAPEFVTVPETTPRHAASRLDQCNCSVAGGFQPCPLRMRGY